jgi:hypothetical protein
MKKSLKSIFRECKKEAEMVFKREGISQYGFIKNKK